MLLNTRPPRPVLEVIPSTPASISLPAPAGRAAESRAPTQGSFHYYGIPPPARISWLAVLLSAGMHAVVILGFNDRTIVKRQMVVEDTSSEMLMMPDLKEPEDDKPKVLSDDEPMSAPSVQVPMLADIPINVPLDNSFTQLVDLTPPMKAEAAAQSIMSIPLNIQRGRPDTSKIKDLFNIADLDRRPEPVVQTQPTYPFEMKRAGIEAQVRIGFIVDNQGNVILPYVISASRAGFERAALEARYLEP